MKKRVSGYKITTLKQYRAVAYSTKRELSGREFKNF